MDTSHNHYYRINKYFLSSIGQWPYQTKLEKYLISCFVFVNIITSIVATVLGMVKYLGDIDMMLECILAIIESICGLTLVTNCVYNMDKVELLLGKIEKDWTTWSRNPEVGILHDYTKNGAMFNFTFAFFVLWVSGLYIMMPITPQLLDFIIPLNVTRPKKTAFPVDYHIDEEKYFYWILILNYITIVTCVIIIIGVDTLLVTFLHHACGIFAILGYRLNSLLKKIDDSSIDKVKSQGYIIEEIKICAKGHKHIIQFVDDINDCFSNTLFVILVFYMLLISITGCQAVIKLHDELREAMRFAALTFGQMFHLFYLSIPSQQLINHSLNISNSIYNGYWYQLSFESQKLLLIIMKRCSEPCTFTAGKIYVYSMQSFASVLQKSMSFFTVLSSLR